MTRRNRTVALAATLLALMCSHCTSPPRPGPQAKAPAPAPPPEPPPRVERQQFEVTAYSIEGTTAKGTRAREGVVAADPDVLPLGSRVRLVDAGEYSGEYVVEDTGRAIDGHELDIYLASDAEAKRFGRRDVAVEILHRSE